MEPRKFYFDTQNRVFTGPPGVLASLAQPVFFQEDVENIELYFFKGPQYADYSSATVKLAVGLTQPAALQTSWTAISTTVTATITSLVAGGSGSNEVQQISFSQPPASGSWAIQLPARNVTVSSVSANVFTAADHGLYSGQSVSLSAFTFTNSAVANGASYFVIRNGKDTFSLSDTGSGATVLGATASAGGTVAVPAITTGQLAHNATPQDAQQAFVAAGLTVNSAPQIIVTGTTGQQYTLNFSNGSANRNYDNVSIVGSTLAAAPGLKAQFSLNTQAVEDLVSAQTPGVRLEVEVSRDGARQTYSTAAELSSDIISSTSPIPAPTGGAVSSLNFNDGSGGTWVLSVDANGVLTTTKS